MPLDYRSAEADAEGIAAKDINGNPEQDSFSSGGAWISARAIDQDVREPACWETRGVEDGLAGFFPDASRARGFRPFSAPWVIPNRWPICWAAFARTRCRGMGISMRVRICRRVRRRRPRWRISAPIAWIAVCLDSRSRAGAEYTRYADDLAFSGGEDFEGRAGRFSTHVAAIVLEQGFSVNHRKTRIMRQGVRQRLAGLTANQRVNVIRADFDRLKATLTNCVRKGAASQNREGHPMFRAHLEGRVGFVESINPAKGRRLRRIFEQIAWP